MLLRAIAAAVFACLLQAQAAAMEMPITAREDAMRIVVTDICAPTQIHKRRPRNIQPVSKIASERSLIMLAQSQIGAGAIYGRRSLWCARFMNWALERSGFHGTGSDLARSFLALPHTSAHVGAIAVLSRGRRSGHVGIVTGFDARGNPIIVSGNHGHRVGVGAYPRGRVLAYVEPR